VRNLVIDRSCTGRTRWESTAFARLGTGARKQLHAELLSVRSRRSERNPRACRPRPSGAARYGGRWRRPHRRAVGNQRADVPTRRFSAGCPSGTVASVTRSALRRTSRDDADDAKALLARIAGSPDLFDHDGRASFGVDRLRDCHDGFTLHDEYAYNAPQNDQAYPLGPSSGKHGRTTRGTKV